VHRTIVLFFLLLLLFTSPRHSFPQHPGLSSPRATPRSDDEPAIPSKMQKDMEKKANAQRQADLKRDTEKLLKLSTELKEYVDKSNENVLSVDVLRRAEEIEKLAHSVKVKMRGDL
jgi:hypothetical protein